MMGSRGLVPTSALNQLFGSFGPVVSAELNLKQIGKSWAGEVFLLPPKLLTIL